MMEQLKVAYCRATVLKTPSVVRPSLVLRGVLLTVMTSFLVLALLMPRAGFIRPALPRRYDCTQQQARTRNTFEHTRQGSSALGNVKEDSNGPADGGDGMSAAGCTCWRMSDHTNSIRVNIKTAGTCSDPRSQSLHNRTVQRVVSFSLYNAKDQWLAGIRENAQGVKNFYPNWVMRIYHDVKDKRSDFCSQLCQIRRRNPHLQLCHVGETLTFSNRQMSGVFPMIWRFLPMVDPFVETFISRDLDSRISEREVSAVEQWLELQKTLHVMRDHPEHNAPILGGMWGVTIHHVSENPTCVITLLQDAFSCMLDTAGHAFCKNLDQEVLATCLWPSIKDTNDYVDHSSFYCGDTFGSASLPFPNQRSTSEGSGKGHITFVGQPAFTYGSELRRCPLECRKQPEWEYC